jgi:uncharacterized membrane protein HdeD (DUF308 family)
MIKRFLNQYRPVREHFWGLRPFKRHGQTLMIAGVCYALTGLVYIITPMTPSRHEALFLALEWFPIEFWGAIFVLVGMAAAISARWPRASDTWGYFLLGGLSAGWSATYALGVIFHDAPLGNLTGTLQWGLLAFVWWAISGFVDPDKTIVVVIEDNGTESNC